MIIELPEDNLRFLISEDNLVHLDDLIKNAYLVRMLILILKIISDKVFFIFIFLIKLFF